MQCKRFIVKDPEPTVRVQFRRTLQRGANIGSRFRKSVYLFHHSDALPYEHCVAVPHRKIALCLAESATFQPVGDRSRAPTIR